jgi:UDP-N-acetylmuramoyl-tripeptide--D-alanyl-D-alanine ligase
VITNTGQAHLEFFPTLDALIDAIWELADTIVGERQMVLNRDDDGLRSRGASYDGPISWYGIEKPCEWHPTDMTRSADGSWRFRIKGIPVTLRVPGRHMVENALAALAVADILGVPLDVAAEALSKTESAERRMRSIIVSDVLILDDVYNANPTSMKAALTTLNTLDGRHIAVLGGMRELGNSSTELHRHVGRFAAERGIHVIAVGELGKDIAEGYRDICDATVIDAPTHDIAIDWLRENVTKGDAVLVKGSRSERMEVVVDALRKHLESTSAE